MPRRVPHTLIAIGLLVGVVATILAACGGSQSPSPQTVTVTSSSVQPTKLSGLQEYQTIEELADDLTKHGHPCQDVTPIRGGYYSVDNAKCTVDGQVMVLALYTSQSQIDAQLAALDSFRQAGLDFGWLAGKNWTINCISRAPCEKLQTDMGGSIVAALPVTPTR